MQLTADDVGHRSSTPVVRLSGITKRFAGIVALNGVNLSLPAGEVHALLGENGAGKSTLMKVLFGVWQPDGGTIEIGGLGSTTISGPRHALSLGIGLVSQEPSIVPQLDVAQNIFLGNARALSISNRSKTRSDARKILDTLAPDLSETAIVADLGMAERQIVEIARALARGGRLIAFDEPTSSLTPNERDNLFNIIRGIKKAGKAIVYISHRMKEIHEIADCVTVLRDGEVVATGPIGRFNTGELNNLIAGRELASELERRPIAELSTSSDEVLRVVDIHCKKLHGISLTLHRGEIFGLVGLVGSGRTELVRAIFGADTVSSGKIEIAGRQVAFQSPREAIDTGIALIPEDRRGQSLVPLMTVEQNFSLGNERSFFNRGILRSGRRGKEIARYISDMGIRPGRADVQIRNLSGGNQQKVIIARWLHTGAQVFLFDEPTRGIDIGAKSEIHDLLRKLASQGVAVLVISSEIPEVLALAQRIGIMREGRMVRIVDNGPGVTEEQLVKLASGEVVCQ